mmetsp:Transcript_516/g.755  ORF Transcript_516/g.755 Transcript_516/m.755 type:complete len:137 (-) Transcript_516:747-1157(-)
MWELAIATVATVASPQAGRGRHSSPATYLLLSLMTAPTSIVDIFWWSPLFAYFASFTTCTGGGWFDRSQRICQHDYVKGLGRLLVSAQSMGTGVFYLMTAITAWGAFVAVRDEQIRDRDAAAFERAMAGVSCRRIT